MVDFAKLKSMSGKKSLEALTNELSKLNDTGKKAGDDRFWTPTVDKVGNGYAVIRFLPALDPEDIPFVRLFDHGFQGPSGLWYIENSLTTIGKPDPVTEYNSKLWNSNSSDDSSERKQARKQKRKLHYISNIYVITDSGNPENEGKVFLFKYGKKIFDKLNESMNPQFPGETPVNPFDLWSGANFKLKIRQVDGYRNYDKSEFDKQSALFEDDDAIEAVYKKEHLLQKFLEPSNFKSYEDLQNRLSKVLNDASTPIPRAEKQAIAENNTPAPVYKTKQAESIPTDGDDESLEFFKNLANK